MIIFLIVEDEIIKIDEDFLFNLYYLIEEKVKIFMKEGLFKKDIN